MEKTRMSFVLQDGMRKGSKRLDGATCHSMAGHEYVPVVSSPRDSDEYDSNVC